MSTLNNTGGRLLAWLRAHLLMLVAAATALGLVVLIFVTTFRLYDARKAADAERASRLSAIEGLAMENRRLAEENAAQDREQCEGINGGNDTLRFLLDGAIRNRRADAPPLTDAERQLTIDTYRRLPQTDCATGAKTYFDPPFPS